MHPATTATPVAVGVDIGGTKAKVCVADLDGTVLFLERLSTTEAATTSALLGDVAASVERFLRSRERLTGATAALVCAGLVTPGVVTDGLIGLAPNNPGMEASNPAQELARLLGLQRVAWANDVKAAAMADHRWGELRGARCGLYINLGTGFSAGAVIDGVPLGGAHGAALEVGYLLPSTALGPGHRSGAAPLEDLISGSALSQRAKDVAGTELSASDVLSLLLEPVAVPPGGPALRDLAEQAVEQLCRAVVNLAVTLDPDTISVGGGVCAAAPAFIPALRSALDEYVPYPPRLVLSSTPDDLSMLGALLLAYRDAGADVGSLTFPGTDFPHAGLPLGSLPAA
ncbi:ROK family protein [Paenarthrobacter sp. DKR-5]|uniref:ROK family protein n=1 Tax=Paenarthrobacter sp. DKR-5 TaxID=2835535 RepID=UPI001BDD58DD|nr:ROK family protein [Paenarthrobacter sp. DKR-5]MBT1004177.1 ROK family protein [Paenarthrobacter sp. DKR-5]